MKVIGSGVYCKNWDGLECKLQKQSPFKRITKAKKKPLGKKLIFPMSASSKADKK